MRVQGKVIAAVSAGGGLGAVLRYAASEAWPTPDGAFPWTTLLVNALGCAAIGLFYGLLEPTAPILLRPFLATGVLGGFTTFSTYAVDLVNLPRETAVGYLLLTVLAALAAVLAGTSTARRIRA